MEAARLRRRLRADRVAERSPPAVAAELLLARGCSRWGAAYERGAVSGLFPRALLCFGRRRASPGASCALRRPAELRPPCSDVALGLIGKQVLFLGNNTLQLRRSLRVRPRAHASMELRRHPPRRVAAPHRSHQIPDPIVSFDTQPLTQHT